MGLDRLATSKPVDKKAALQLGRGIHWMPEKKHKPHVRRWEDMPTDLLRPHPCDPISRRTFRDLTGKKTGRFTVIGYLGKLNAKKKALWLVRCTCGMFEARTAAAVATANPNDACCDCLYLRQVKRGNGHRPASLPSNTSSRP